MFHLLHHWHSTALFSAFFLQVTQNLLVWCCLFFLPSFFGDIFTTSLTVTHILCEVQLVMYLYWCTLHFIGTINLKPQYNKLSARSLAFVDQMYLDNLSMSISSILAIQILRLLHWGMHCSWKNEYLYLSMIGDLWMFYTR